MADNVTISTAGGTETIAADEVASVKYPRNKLIFGADGANSGDVQLASTTVLGPLPVNAYPATDFITLAGLGVAPQFAVIDLTATGTLVTAQAGKRIRVISLAMTYENITGDETYIFRTGAAGTALTGSFGDVSAAITTGSHVLVLPFNPCGWFQTNVGDLLELALGGTTPLADGCLTWIPV